MNIEVSKKENVRVTHIVVRIPILFDDEDVPYDFPLRTLNMWNATINLETGNILEWPKGKSGILYTKVCDEGVYKLCGPKGIVSEIDNCYVPLKVLPGNDDDYIDFEINKEGNIENWRSSDEMNFSDFQIKE